MYSALVQPVRGKKLLERRNEERHHAGGEATSQTVENAEGLYWGATIRDISVGGVGLSLCFPFRTGTFLSINLKNNTGTTQSILSRVVHVNDQADGTWAVGCEFLEKLSQEELDTYL